MGYLKDFQGCFWQHPLFASHTTVAWLQNALNDPRLPLCRPFPHCTRVGLCDQQDIRNGMSLLRLGIKDYLLFLSTSVCVFFSFLLSSLALWEGSEAPAQQPHEWAWKQSPMGLIRPQVPAVLLTPGRQPCETLCWRHPAKLCQNPDPQELRK